MVHLEILGQRDSNEIGSIDVQNLGSFLKTKGNFFYNLYSFTSTLIVAQSAVVASMEATTASSSTSSQSTEAAFMRPYCS